MTLKHLVIHTPGPQWQADLDFREQVGVKAHVSHYQEWFDNGKLSQGGPFLEANSGGMMIAANGVTKEELETFAASDPAVKSGLLNYQVKQWYVAMENN